MSLSIRGRCSNSQPFSFVACSPKYAFIRLTQYCSKFPHQPVGAVFALMKVSSFP